MTSTLLANSKLEQSNEYLSHITSQAFSTYYDWRSEKELFIYFRITHTLPFCSKSPQSILQNPPKQILRGMQYYYFWK